MPLLLACLLPLPAHADPPATHTTPQPSPAWDTYPDTWVATDALGRSLPTAAEVGPPRADRTLGMFYFLTFDHNQEAVYDNTKILAAHPEAITDIHNPAWGPLNRSHYWGEPLFGYYASDDPAVLRKHAAMLANAGVDLVIFDNSNAVTYDRARRTLCETWEAIRKAGGRTPRIAFLCPFGNPGHIGSNTLRELYDTLYGPGLYRDLWFLWDGKPVVMADPSFADPIGNSAPDHTPTALTGSQSLGQTFVADRPFISVGGEFPTWNTTDSAMTLTLYADGPAGQKRLFRRFDNVRDNAELHLDSDHALPPGKYYLEMSAPRGQIGWWGYAGKVYDNGQAYQDGAPTGGGRSLHVRYADSGAPATLIPDPTPYTTERARAESEKLRDFFTFRSPIAPYNITKPEPNHWAWLQVAPQAPQVDAAGKVEEITVGVAQNYNATVNNTAPMSVDGAFGRTYHAGHRDTSPGAVQRGGNFAEQWETALKVDPPFVFVTGWNEWTAGFYDSWVRWTAPPPIFVDEFTEEFSRDIEPMRDTHGPDGVDRATRDRGHGDDYYYQFVAANRRYKGARTLPAVTPHKISLAGPFTQWQTVQPEYRDAIGDPVHRDWPGITKDLRYVNQTGRNDIVAAKVTYDRDTVTFYVRTHDALTAPTGDNWMLLFLNVHAANSGNPGSAGNGGWLGYNFVVNRHVGAKTTTLERHVGGPSDFRWEKVADIAYRRQGDELMLAIPRRLLGLPPTGPATIDFKWADNCLSTTPSWSDFTLNGDAAPDDRFNYRALMIGK